MVPPAMCMFVPGVCVPVRSPERSNCTNTIPDICPGFLFSPPQPRKTASEKTKARSTGHLLSRSVLLFYSFVILTLPVGSGFLLFFPEDNAFMTAATPQHSPINQKIPKRANWPERSAVPPSGRICGQNSIYPRQKKAIRRHTTWPIMAFLTSGAFRSTKSKKSIQTE